MSDFSLKYTGGRSPNRSSGMTLIEVLVSVLITAIGLLGIAVLQSTALKSGIDSSQRTIAAAIANDVLDRMRANPAGRNANSYSAAFAALGTCNNVPATICSDYYNQSSGSVVQAASCTGAQLAAFDAWELGCGYSNAGSNFSSPADFLISPTITVACTDAVAGDGINCSDTSTHSITVQWSVVAQDQSRGGVAETESLTISAEI